MDDDSWDSLLGAPESSRPASRRSRGRRSALASLLRDDDLEPPSPHPLTPAGPRLKRLREPSGWTVEEIADRTGVPLHILTAFEQGDSSAAESLTLADLEHLASACCGSLSDLLSPEERREAKRKEARRGIGSGFSLDPFGF